MAEGAGVPWHILRGPTPEESEFWDQICDRRRAARKPRWRLRSDWRSRRPATRCGTTRILPSPPCYESQGIGRPSRSLWGPSTGEKWSPALQLCLAGSHGALTTWRPHSGERTQRTTVGGDNTKISSRAPLPALPWGRSVADCTSSPEGAAVEAGCHGLPGLSWCEGDGKGAAGPTDDGLLGGIGLH
ncbi:hypothetical protein NDU88_001370 [Pleurodeles waltl]|uniref:Uncharacterized protein n=1 Tax=Pleurodeles waltl TaxID=8319 RepID=A0AAV7WI51_PLEWA|nr:hypothetical protein NDU88_001370 [Pleurodeles waltl]